jgi:ankyrin repeat protein
VNVLLSKGDIGSGVVGFRPAGAPRGTEGEALCVQNAVKFIQMLEGDVRHDGLVVKPLGILENQEVFPNFDFNPAARVVNIRARLGYLTGDQFQPTSMQWDPELQATARILQKVLGEAVGYIFRKVPLRRAWKGVKALTWSTVAVCQYAWDEASEATLTFPIHFLALQKGQQWIVNEHQLAAVISLCRNEILHNTRRPNRWFYANRKVMQAVGGPERTAAIIRLWVAKDCELEQKIRVQEPSNSASLIPFKLSLPEAKNPAWWKIYQDEAVESDRPDSELAWLLALSTSGTLLELIAQDIFTIFMFEIASIMEKLTEVSVRQPIGSSLDNTTLHNPSITASELSNTHIDELAKILYGAGLATEEAALMSIVPAIFHHGKLPSLNDSVGWLLDDARKLRTDQQYEKGAARLKSLLKIRVPEQHERVLRALGELFRHALRAPRAAQRDFGLRAMGSLKKDLVYEGAPTLSRAAMVALCDYGSLAEFLHDRSRGPRSLWNSESRANLGVSPVLELHKELDQPPENRSHLKTLMVLEKYDMTGCNNSAIHELLFVAIALGHVEVLEDLRALNHDLIFEAPSLVTLTGNPPCSSASIWSKFNADKLAQVEGQVRSGNTVGFLAAAWAVSQLGHKEILPGEAEVVLRTMLNWASVDKDFTDGHINTLLTYAVKSGNTQAVDILLESGAIIDDRNELGEALLYPALQPFWNQDAGDTKPDPALVSLLLKHGATVGHRLADILEAAVDNLAADWIRHLHARGHDVLESPILKRGLAAVLEVDKPNERDLDPDPSYAPKKRHQTDALIGLLFDLELPLHPGDLHRAVRLRPSDGILAEVLGKGTFDDEILKDHGTPLQVLLNYDLWDGPGTEQERILDMMLRAGCDPNLDSPGWKATPLQIACSYATPLVRGLDIPQQTIVKYGDSETAALTLTRAGADVNLTAADIPGEGRQLVKSTPLELACLTGKNEVVKALIKAGANVNTPGGEFGPPLQAACFQFGQRLNRDVDSETVRALIKAGADVNVVAKPGGTALAAAAHSLQPRLVKILLEAGANPRLHTLSRPSTSLFPELFSIFGDMQTGIFESRTWTRDTEGSRESAEQIVGLFAQHGVVLSPEALLHPENH